MGAPSATGDTGEVEATRRPRTVAVACAAFLLAALLIGCGTEAGEETAVAGDPSAETTAPADEPVAAEAGTDCEPSSLTNWVASREKRAARYEGGSGAASSLAGPSRLADVLPNVKWEVPGEGTKPLNTRVVVGEVVDVRHGVGVHRRPPADDPTDQVRGDQEVISFDDDRAYLQTLAVTITVDETIAGPEAERIIVEWHLLGGDRQMSPPVAAEDPELVACALRQAGRSLWLVSEAFLHYDTSTIGTASFALLDAQEHLDFPLMHGEAERAWIGDLTTLSAVREEAAKPQRSMRYEGGRPVPG